MKPHNYCISFLLCSVSLVFILCCSQTALSQVLKGRVYINGTHMVLDSVSVKVAAATQTIYTDKNGEFEIRVKTDDLLILSAYGYKTDTLLVTTTRFQEIYLAPIQHMLKEVKVNANNIAPRHGPAIYDPDFHGQTVSKQFDDKGNYKGGAVIRLWYWKKDEKRRKKNEQTQKADATYQQIAQVFCKDSVQKYLPLKNEEVSGFLLRYTPGTEEFMSPGFNLTIYLNKCYKEFKILPEEERSKSPDL